MATGAGSDCLGKHVLRRMTLADFERSCRDGPRHQAVEQREIGMVIPSNYPFAGDRFNVTMAGIHADGVMKDEEIYNIFDTVKILNRPHGVIITNRTGLAGVGFWVNQELERRGLPAVDKRDPRVEKMFKWIEQQYVAGRVTCISPQEMREQFIIHFPE